MKIKYPTKCQIVDVFYSVIDGLECRTPEVSKPHFIVIFVYGLC